MKITGLVFLFFLLSNICAGQISNIKAGVWSDKNNWSSHAIPGSMDNVVLQFDVVVDINGFCRSLHTNGHKVIVNAGVTLNIADTSHETADPSVLLKLVNINYDHDNNFGDSSLRVIRNVSVNGKKKIIITETAIPADKDTVFDVFDYDSLNRLTRYSYYWNDTTYIGVYTDNFHWENGRVTRITSDSSGQVYRTDTLFYAPADTNLIISLKTIPPENPDTVYIDGQIFTFSVVKSYLTVDSHFTPLSKKSFEHSYNVEGGIGTGNFSEHYDTTTVNYYYANGNLDSADTYRTGVDTIVNFPSPPYRNVRYTQHDEYKRNLAENPAVYNVLKAIYGDTLLTLMNFMNLNFDDTWVLGVGYGGTFAHYKQTASLARYKFSSWINGVLQPYNGPEYINDYRADNRYDAQNRLVQSDIHNQDFDELLFTLRIIYP